MEILSPAGCFESLIMAVQNGADAVYVGGDMFSARANAKNFDRQQLKQGLDYCHLRGVKLYLAVNTLIKETELSALYDYLSYVYSIGVDAVIVQDLAVLTAIGDYLPDLPIHASTQMTVHNIDGTVQLEQMGAKRVVLARELSQKQISFIAKNTRAELEVFVHGALCISYSGQCLMSSMIGGRSGNRGSCAQPCRLPYTLYEGGKQKSATDTLLSPKDLCLADRISELKKAGVHSLKIEGRMKSPAYVGMVTRVYKEAILKGADQKEIETMLGFFSRGGSSYGYFDGKPLEMDYGEKSKITAHKDAEKAICRTAKGENKRSSVSLFFEAQGQKPMTLTLLHEKGISVTVRSGFAEPAIKSPTTAERVKEQLCKLGNTPYQAEEIQVLMGKNLSVSIKDVNELRRQGIQRLEEEICGFYRREPTTIPLPEVRKREFPRPILTAEVKTLAQAKAALRMGIERVYLPVSLYEQLDSDKKIAVLPSVIKDEEFWDISKMNEVMIENIGQFSAIKGKKIYTGHRLNVFNSQTLEALAEQGAYQVTLSPELNLSEIRSLLEKSHHKAEVIVYGRLPLMYMEHCIIKSNGSCSCQGKNYELKDRKEEKFPLLSENCRNILYNSKPIYMADRMNELKKMKINSMRLLFTVENPDLCCIIIEEYKKALQGEEIQNTLKDYTRGHFYRGTV